MSAAGRRASGAIRSTIGAPKASVLPEPVGDLASTSRPAKHVGDDELLDGERSVDAALFQRIGNRAGYAEIGEGLL